MLDHRVHFHFSLGLKTSFYESAIDGEHPATFILSLLSHLLVYSADSSFLQFLFSRLDRFTSLASCCAVYADIVQFDPKNLEILHPSHLCITLSIIADIFIRRHALFPPNNSESYRKF